ncbi:MAG: radical SAM protein [Deltaproteobacteria bacterium]|jgi:wyosine [tRNA(Phe)-imidazoG37] synthetase (radical SAM superfamily)|nr:radical SAM protein [Deltaproteobacteria bacterium]
MKHLFGPVFSRRLGLSQGIDLLPPKTCNYNCIYCEINRAPQLSCERREHVPTSEIIAEIDTLLANKERVRKIDVFTITASGEPTLHTGLGRVINHIKEKTDKPVAILTNGSQLYLEEVRRDLQAADIVIPSLDAARAESFRKVNRPAKCSSDLETIIAGIVQFSNEFSGDLWLEILLVENINDADEDIEALKKAIAEIKPKRVQLNTVARPPFETFAKPLTRRRLEEVRAAIAEVYTGPVDILAGSKEAEDIDLSKEKVDTSEKISLERVESEIIEMVLRRPCTAAEIAGTLNLEAEDALEILVDMESRGDLLAKIHGDKMYFRAAKEHID